MLFYKIGYNLHLNIKSVLGVIYNFSNIKIKKYIKMIQNLNL